MKNKCVVNGCSHKGTRTVWLHHAFCEQHRAVGESRWGHVRLGQTWVPGIYPAHEGRKRGQPVRAWREGRRLKEYSDGE